MRKWLSGVLTLVLAVTVLSGCSFGFGKNDNGSSNEGPQTLKVMYYDESSFYQEYGMLYSAINPDIEIEVISTNNLYNEVTEEKDYNQVLAEFLEKEKPDIIMSDMSSMKNLIEKNLFYDLESYVSQPDYNLEGLGSGVVEAMKEVGNGILYGIPTSISSQVIYYNKDLFDEYSVPYPTDSMTWSEIINLANMFPTDGEYPDRVYGLKLAYSNQLADIITSLYYAEGLQQYDPETLTMTMDTPAWNALVQSAVDIYNSGALYYDELRWNSPINYEDPNYDSIQYPLVSGMVAMVYEGSYYLNELNNAKQYSRNPENFTDNWDIVAPPSSSVNGNVSNSVYYGNILSIYSGSTNIDAAWDFLSYVTGDEFARVKSKVNYGSLPIRKQYALQDSTKNIDAFYAMKPDLSQQTMDTSEVPQLFLYEFYSVMYEEFNKLQEGTATVDEVLATLQLRGNELLAKGVMTDEELQKYWEENSGVFETRPAVEIIDEEVSVEATEEQATTEEVVE